jgi:hypothetical protein
MKINIDASCDFNYSSYYILGLKEFYGANNIYYTSKGFEQFRHNNDFFAFEIVSNQSYKVIVDFGDSSKIEEIAYKWCDIYAKINLTNFGMKAHEKTIPIGPSFGIQIENFYHQFSLCITNLIKGWSRIKNKKKFVSDYYHNYKQRLCINSYQIGNIKDKYIYFNSSIWKNDTQTNICRKNFIQSCKNNNNINFEGGFAPRNDKNNLGYEEFITERCNLNKYIDNIKKSTLVFNTPAVKGCHGWKLAEFCALGKTIISTPLSRELPGNFIKDVHFIETDGTIENQTKIINCIMNDEPKRIHLQENVRNYYETYLKPIKVIERINTQLQLI